MNEDLSRDDVEANQILVWIALLSIFSGFNLHRMGPSFDRRSLGFPLLVFGTSILIILYLEPFGYVLSGPEKEIIDSLASSFHWVVLALSGSFLIIYSIPTYGNSNGSPALSKSSDSFLAISPGKFTILAGWISLGLSWGIIFYSRLPSLLDSFILGISVLLGILIGALFFVLGVWMAEKGFRMQEEVNPLSNSEGILVSKIIRRNLEGNEGDH